MAIQGFGDLFCPLCGKVGAITIDLSDADTFKCPECDEDFCRSLLDDAIADMARWGKVLTWLDSLDSVLPPPAPLPLHCETQEEVF